MLIHHLVALAKVAQSLLRVYTAGQLAMFWRCPWIYLSKHLYYRRFLQQFTISNNFSVLILSCTNVANRLQNLFPNLVQETGCTSKFFTKIEFILLLLQSRSTESSYHSDTSCAGSIMRLGSCAGCIARLDTEIVTLKFSTCLKDTFLAPSENDTDIAEIISVLIE